MLQRRAASLVLIFNDKGDLALQLRSKDDASYPSHWDFSAGGKIDIGEDPKVAAHRELKEEIGIEAELEFLGEDYFEYPAWSTGEMKGQKVFIYKALHNGPFFPDAREVERVEFFSFEKIKDMIEKKEKIHPEFVWCFNKGSIF